MYELYKIFIIATNCVYLLACVCTYFLCQLICSKREGGIDTLCVHMCLCACGRVHAHVCECACFLCMCKLHVSACMYVCAYFYTG